MKVFRRNIELISNDNVLRFYGIALLLIHVLTIYFWQNKDLANIICWPFLKGCHNYSFIFGASTRYFLSLYSVISFCGIIAFFKRRVSLGYWMLLLACLLKLSFHLIDYRNMGNYHYIHHILCFVYLFAFNKKDILKIIIVLVYISAGLLKFNSDWLSGVALTRPINIDGKILEWLCAYVIILELLISHFLLSTNRLLFYFSFSSFIIFHLFSWLIVGYYYPLVMLLALSIFILDRTKVSFKFRPFDAALIIIFIMAQLIPFLFFSGSYVSGEGRVMSLNMLDAKTVCDVSFIIKKEKESIEYNPTFEKFGYRIHCDPIVIVDQLNKTCLNLQGTKGFQDIDVMFYSRMTSSRNLIKKWSFENTCSHKLEISLLGKPFQGDYQREN